jgi:thioredoxin 1
MSENMSEKKIITFLPRNIFAYHLENNKGGFIVKFGAEWCGPCKKIEGLVKDLMNQTPENVTCAIIDVDENFEIYAFFKNKRLMTGIPSIFGYKQGNISHIPDDIVMGTEESQIRHFFSKYMDVQQI